LIEKVSSPKESDYPRWTLPKRMRMDQENLHISSFVMPKDSEGSILFLRAGPKHPVSFKRDKYLLPATILSYGEVPKVSAQRVLGEQIKGAEDLKVSFVTFQSYLGAHWDIVFLFETNIDDGRKKLLLPREPYTELGFFKMSSLPRQEIAEDHLEVLDELTREIQSGE
jgi:hypothetical protein